MNNIIECIYKSCDQNNSQLVAVSALIDFVKPYMLNNLSELTELQSQLDPMNTNPCIDYSSFERVMTDWIAGIQASDIQGNFSGFTMNFQSNLLEASFIDNTSNTMNDNSSCNTSVDFTLQEQIETLKQQLNKALSDLTLAKQQLAACEEQNESLLADLNKYIELNNKKCCVDEPIKGVLKESDAIVEESGSVQTRCQQLEKLVGNYVKQLKEYLEQISQLDKENLQLQNKLKVLENNKKENRKTVNEMQQLLEMKESEIISLMEVMDRLKSELAEKTDLQKFYIKEIDLFKHKVRDLELLLSKSNQSFHTPKLQFSSPVGSRTSTSSSPRRNCSFQSANSSFDLLSSTVDVITTQRSPHKTLKEELAEVSQELNESNGELEHLHKLVKEQEEIKNSLWENMKQLTNDNEELRQYKNDYFDLLSKMQEQDRVFEIVKEESDNKKVLNEEVVLCLTSELSNLEENLNEQKMLNTEIQTKLAVLSDNLNLTVANIADEKPTTTDRSIQTDSNTIPAIKNNFSKQQLRIDRLLENQEKVQKDLVNERRINSKLTAEYEEICKETKKIRKELESHRNKVFYQEILLRELNNRIELVENEKYDIISKTDHLYEELAYLTTQNNNLSDTKKFLLSDVDILKEAVTQLSSENSIVQQEKENLLLEITSQKQVLTDQSCEIDRLRTENRNLVLELTAESAKINQLRMEKEQILNNQLHLETKIKKLFYQLHLMRQLIDSKNALNLSVKQLHGELFEKETQIRTLKKEIVVHDVKYFLDSCNNELKRVMVNSLYCFKCDDALSRTIIETIENFQNSQDVESEMINLGNNVELIVLMLETICNKYSNALSNLAKTEQRTEVSSSIDVISENFDKSDEEMCNEDSFVSCSSEDGYFVQELFERIFSECGSFLDSVQFEDVDLRHMTRNDMQEKFTTLALQLMLDVPTLKKKLISGKNHLLELYTNCFSHLDYVLHLLNKSEKSRINATALHHLNLIKELNEDFLRSAIKCGVFHYENKMVNCWKLVMNYIADLSQENKRLKKNKQLQISVLPSFSVCDDNRTLLEATPSTLVREDRSSHFKYGIYTLFLLIFVSFVLLLLYVDHLCPKNGKRVCPLQLIKNLFVEKTYSQNVHL